MLGQDPQEKFSQKDNKINWFFEDTHLTLN